MKLAVQNIPIVTSGNEFPISIESPCHYGGIDGDGSESLRAIPHPIQLSNDLWFYPSPAPLWGQPDELSLPDDPLAPESEHRDVFEDYLQCVEARLAAASEPSDSIVRYNGQTFVWSGTSHLHNYIEGEPDQLPDAESGDPSWPAGVVELAKYKAMMEELISVHNAEPSRRTDLSIQYRLLSDIHSIRDMDANHNFEVLLDAE